MSDAGRRRLSSAVVGMAACFLAVLAALHALEPEFDPAHRMISEYEVGRYGWLMRCAFVALGAALLGLSLLLWPFVRRVGLGLVPMALALFGAAVFETDSLMAAPSHGAANTIHQACGAIVILGFPVIATLLARRIGRQAAWASTRRWLWSLTALSWAGQIAFFSAVKVLGRPPVGAVGWPNRLMMLAYSAWILAVTWRAGHLPLEASGRGASTGSPLA